MHNRVTCLFAVTLSLAAAGCTVTHRIAESLPFVYRLNVQQGNVITQDMLAQLRPGMEKAKVMFILGTPVIQDTFHQSRWDYVYTDQERSGTRFARRLSVFFSGDKLIRVAGNIKAATGPIAHNPTPEVTVDVPRMERPGFVARMLASVGIGDDRMRPVTTEATSVAVTSGATGLATDNAANANLADPVVTATSNAVRTEQKQLESEREQQRSAENETGASKPIAKSAATPDSSDSVARPTAVPVTRDSTEDSERPQSYRDPTQIEENDAL